MKNNMFRKSLVIGIIILFLGASVIPSISGEYKQEVENLSLVKNQSALNSNLIAYWSFNDGTAKDNENDHDGVIYGNPLFDDSGGPDGSGCFELDGSDDYIDIPDTSHFGFANQDVTLTAWVQIVDNANMYRNFIHLGATNAEEQICLQLTKARSELGGYDGKMFMAVRNGDPIAYAAMSIKNGDELPKNQWIFLAGVIDSSSKIIKLYLDGSYQESASYPDYDLTDANILALNIGRAPYGYSNTYHNSFIDEVRIYDKALSEDEIQVLYENPGQDEDDLYITNVEPIQVIQNAEEFIINKNTVACVHVASSFIEQKLADIEITYNFGQTYTETGPNEDGIPLEPGLNRVYIPGGPVFHESGQTDAWIDAGTGPWLTWTSTGTDNNIMAYVDCNNDVSETNEANNQNTISETFVNSINFRVMVVPVFFPEAPLGNKSFTVDMGDQQGFILGTYPIPEDHFDYDILTARSFNGNPHNESPEWFYNNTIIPLVNEANGMNYDRVVVVLHEDWGKFGYAIGMDHIPLMREPVIVTNYWGNGSLVAHEIGHTYYLWHPHDIGPPVNDSYCYHVKNRDYERYGRTFMSYWWKLPVEVPEYPIWIDKGRYDSNPNETRSYTDPVSGDTINGSSWNLFDQFIETDKQKDRNQEIIVISGIINKKGTVDSVDPWYHITDGKPNLYPNEIGDYFIVLSDIQQNVLSKSGFNVSFEYWMEDENGNHFLVSSNSTAFAFRIPYISGVKNIELWDSNDNVVLSKTISDHSPTVEVIYPNGGEEITIGEDVTITWNANDLDGDLLEYNVLYNFDDEDWTPIDWRLTEKQCIWNTSGFIPGDTYQIRVMACDGINTGTDESDGTFSLISAPPYPPTISGPTSGTAGEDYDYTFFTNDPEEDDVCYYVDWGDDTSTGWTDYAASGTEVTLNHTWTSQGSYTIKAKAKDIYGAESDWGELQVTMPKNKQYLNTPFLNFLQNYPNLFRITEKLFQRLGLY